jgi:hypothetical protein
MRSSSLLACLALAGAAPFTAPHVALAQSPPSPATPAPKTQARWYGWQILASDAVFASLSIVTVATSQGGNVDAEVGLVGLGYLLDGPIIHAIHRRYVASALSVGARLALPLIGAGIGAAAARCPPDIPSAQDDYYPPDPCWAPLAFAATGFLTGMIVASIVDSAAFSWEQVPGTADTAKPQATGSFLLVPQAAMVEDPAHRRAVTIGIAGTF